MDIFIVGGAVRDQMLGLPVSDRDYVVVGATPEQMLAQGFRPVGKDFPVFLHPATQEEYALARTERKTGAGYKGFAFHAASDVTLEQDLARRDLTINAMARAQDGSLIDPYGGSADLQARVLRHVSSAFCEDPVRILRLARFAARFADFQVAPETFALMQQMVQDGEVDALVPERVWQEVARGLMEQQPSRMLNLLHECGALARIMPELDRLWGVPQPPLHHPEVDTGVHMMLVVDDAARHAQPLEVRFAALMHDLGKGVTPDAIWPRHHGHEGEGVALVNTLCERLRVPGECRDLAVLCAREHGALRKFDEMRSNTIIKLFTRCDAWRKPQRFRALLAASESDVRGRGGSEQEHAARAQEMAQQSARWSAALQAAQAIDTGAIARAAAQQYPGQPQRIADAIYRARVSALHAYRRSTNAELPEQPEP